MRFRRALLPLLVVAIVSPWAVPARAGGSWLETDRRAYVPADMATLRGRFDMSGSLDGTFADGPYVAYLLREGRWIQRGRVPEDAIRLGEIHIVRSGSSYPTRAVVTFEVPQLPTGWYHVGYCNEPCTVDGIGDLIGSDRFVIAPTRAEGRAIARIDRLEAKVHVVRRRVVARTRDERKRLEDELADRTELLRLSQERASELAAGAGRLPGSVVAAPVVRVITTREPSVTWWIALLALLAGLAAGVVVGHRRSVQIVVPDTVPDDLEEREAIPLSR